MDTAGGSVHPEAALPPRLYVLELNKYSSPSASALPFESLARSLLERIIFDEDESGGPRNVLVLHETYVIRLFRRLCDAYRVSWNSILETTRQGCCVLDAHLHGMLSELWETRLSRSVSLDEQNCYERVMGRDHVRLSDLQKLAGTLARVAESKRVWTFFGVDGYLGDDPKRYVDHLRYANDAYRGKHVAAVRILYLYLDHPHQIHDALESLFFPRKEGIILLDPRVRDEYVRTVGGWDVVRQIGEWRTEQKEKRKKSSGDETTTTRSGGGGKRKGKEDVEENDEDATTTTTSRGSGGGGGKRKGKEDVEENDEDATTTTTSRSGGGKRKGKENVDENDEVAIATTSRSGGGGKRKGKEDVDENDEVAIATTSRSGGGGKRKGKEFEEENDEAAVTTITKHSETLAKEEDDSNELNDETPPPSPPPPPPPTLTKSTTNPPPRKRKATVSTKGTTSQLF
ncbi:hypothetical protein JTE90_000026 [Oedothorax gibbosus]|uniref:Uncharacterized protein n=1 Tax=Oedothorax gibbosus TaxID=931172 RepID=A0AAV6TKR6_9ARAC|nr:hypothetical protein JTE90_000026 [Oedothorax gibbosus]